MISTLSTSSSAQTPLFKATNPPCTHQLLGWLCLPLAQQPTFATRDCFSEASAFAPCSFCASSALRVRRSFSWLLSFSTSPCFSS
jgi:hypothetical protein